MKIYKLTDNAITYNNTYWEVGTTNTVKKAANSKTCTSDVLHGYLNLDVGLLLNPIHANYNNIIVFECIGNICIEEWDKVGSFELEVVRKITLPKWYTDTQTRQKVQVMFANLCAEHVLHIYEKRYPNDPRVRNTIEAAKGHLNNSTITTDVLGAVHKAVRDAANAATKAAQAAHAVECAILVSQGGNAGTALLKYARPNDAYSYVASRAANAAACAVGAVHIDATSTINLQKIAAKAIKESVK